jgi:hypothetical protein
MNRRQQKAQLTGMVGRGWLAQGTNTLGAGSAVDRSGPTSPESETRAGADGVHQAAPSGVAGKSKREEHTCPKCGLAFDPVEHQVIECPRCGVQGSTNCCNPGGRNCICAACEEKGAE